MNTTDAQETIGRCLDKIGEVQELMNRVSSLGDLSPDDKEVTDDLTARMLKCLNDLGDIMETRGTLEQFAAVADRFTKALTEVKIFLDNRIRGGSLN